MPKKTKTFVKTQQNKNLKSQFFDFLIFIFSWDFFFFFNLACENSDINSSHIKRGLENQCFFSFFIIIKDEIKKKRKKNLLFMIKPFFFFNNK